MAIVNVFGGRKRKQEPTSIELYRRSGKFQESILPFDENETPQDGDYRIYKNSILQYNKEAGGYTETMRLFDEAEKPSDGSLRLQGNTILRYDAKGGGYRVHKDIPSTFIGPSRHRMPSLEAKILDDPFAYMKETAKAFPKSALNLAEGMLRYVDPTNPVWKLRDPQLGLKPGEAMFPKTTEAAETNVLKVPGAVVSDIANIPIGMAKMVLGALTRPQRTLREDPAGFIAAVLIAKAGMKGGPKVAAKVAAKAYEKGSPMKVLDAALSTPLSRRISKGISKRVVDVARGEYTGEYLIQKATEGLSKLELEAMPFIREGLKDVKVLKKIGRSDLEPYVKNPSPKVKQALVEFDKLFKKDWRIMEKYFDATEFVENYVPQLWERPKGWKSSDVINHFQTKNPFAKGRIFENLQEGIKAGFKPKTTNINDIYRIYNKYKHQVRANVDMYDMIKSLPDEQGNPVIVKSYQEGQRLGYRKLEHPVFGGDRQAWVHPDIYAELNSVWGKASRSSVGVQIDTLNSIMKYSQLTLSLFHHGALTETAFGVFGLPKTIAAWGQSIKRFAKGEKPAILKKPNIANDAVGHRVRIAASPDVHINKIESLLKSLEGTAQVGESGFVRVFGPKPLAGAPSRLIKGWNSFLWDHLHSTFKVMGYEKLKANELPRIEKWARKKYGKELTPEDINTIKNQIGDFINDSFGGQNWELSKYLNDPKMKVALRRILLAPDWTYSVVRQATSLTRGPTKARLGEILMERGQKAEGWQKLLEGKTLTDVSRKYWTRMLAYAFVTTQAVNQVVSKKLYGKGRFTWENAPGHEYHILVGRGQLGKNIEGEQEIYLRIGKQLSEPIRWLTKPLEIGGAKLSPLLGLAARQVTGHDPGSGWPTDYADENALNKGWKRLKDVSGLFIPFSLKSYVQKQRGPGQFLFMFPMSRGLNIRKTKRYFRQAFRIKDEDQRKDRMAHIQMAAQQNGIDWGKPFTDALGAERRQQQLGERTALTDKVWKEVREAPDIETKINIINTYVSQNRITSLQQKTIMYRLKEGREIEERSKILEQEQTLIRRISGNRWINASGVHFTIRDDYASTRDKIELYFKDGKVDKAIETRIDWHNQLDGHLNSLSEFTDKNANELKTTMLYRNYFLTKEKMQNLFRISKTPAGVRFPLDEALKQRQVRIR